MNTEEQNEIYLAQLKELVSIFSSTESRYTRQYIINIATGVIEKENDEKIKAYVDDIVSTQER